MTLAALIPLVLKASIIANVFALGLGASVADLLSLRTRPVQLLKSLTAMDLIMPLVAVGLALAFDLKPPVEIALVALSISPVPPLLPRKELKAGATTSFAHGLLLAAALFAIVFVPLALEVIGRVFGLPIHVSPVAVAKVVAMTVLAPLGAGMLVKAVARGLAGRIAGPLSLAATVLLFASVAPVLFIKWPAIVSLVGNGTLWALAAFILVGLVAGHLLGGPDPADRTVLAFSTASRHPGVALAIASANFPDQKLVMPAILLYLFMGAILTIPYARWRRARQKAAAPEAPQAR